MHSGCFVSLWVSIMSWSIVAVSIAQKFFLPPVWLFPNHWFDSAFFIPCFGQKYFNSKLYCDSYVLMIRNRCICGRPLSFGNRITMDMSHLDVQSRQYCGVSSTSFHWNPLCSRCIDCRLVKVSYDGDLNVFLRERLLWPLHTFWNLVYMHEVVWIYLLLC